MGDDRSGDQVDAPAKTPAPADSTPASPRSDVLDFGSVDCNTAAPKRTLSTPIAPSDSVWNTTLDGTTFHAQPVTGMLTTGQAAKFDVLAPMLANITSVEPITAKLTVALLDAADRNQVTTLRVQPHGAILKFPSAVLDFQTLTAALVGATRTIDLTNNGNATVTFTIASDNKGYAVTPATVTLAPKETQQITVKFINQSGSTSAKAVITATTGAVCYASPLSFTGKWL